MKKRIFGPLLPVLGVLLGILLGFKFPGSKVKDELVMQMLTSSLSAVHFAPKNFNDEFSGKMFDMYLERLDYNKKFLLQEDVEELKKLRNTIDDDINNGSFKFFSKAHELITMRTKESETYYKDALMNPFEFSSEEEIETDPKKLLFCKTKDELKESWRKSMKYQVLIRVNSMIDEKEKADSTKKYVPDAAAINEMEIKAREKVGKSNEDFFYRLSRLDRTDRYNGFLNCIANMYDPHTEFFPPKDKKNFDIQMSGQLEGIGAQLQERDGAIKVSSIVPGSASWKQGQLKAGDIIQKVAQGDKDPVDVTEMKLDDAIELIRGKKGTEVRLTIKKPDGNIIVIPIIRDVVVLEETYARSSVIKSGNKKIGFIHLPSFYADFRKPGGRTCSKDIKAELEKLKEDNVDGIIIDLRNNGGGSLQDVIRMMGLFIQKGPVVQVMSRDNDKPKVYGDDDPGIVYDGPLAIMVNENSASASEILAAAVQDYKRGVIIGSKTTFGKGTVQQFVNLDEYLLPQFDSLKPVGEVKLTIQKFYRINGGSTQLKGVVPDIILPDIYKYIEDGEKDLDFPLPYDEVSKASFSDWSNKSDLNSLRQKSEKRVKDEKRFQLINEWADILKKEKDETKYSMQLDKFRKFMKERDAQSKQYEKINEERKLEISIPKADKTLIEGDSIKLSRNNDWFKNIRKDVYIWESLNIISDMK